MDLKLVAEATLNDLELRNLIIKLFTQKIGNVNKAKIKEKIGSKKTPVNLWSLTRLFKSRSHDFSTYTGTIVQQSLVRFFKLRYCHDCSTVTSTMLYSH